MNEVIESLRGYVACFMHCNYNMQNTDLMKVKKWKGYTVS